MDPSFGGKKFYLSERNIKFDAQSTDTLLLFQCGFAAAAGTEDLYAVSPCHVFDIRYQIFAYDAHFFQVGEIYGGVGICERVKPPSDPFKVRISRNSVAANFAEREFIFGSGRNRLSVSAV